MMIFFPVLAFAALAGALATPNTRRHSQVAKSLLDFLNPDIDAYLSAHNTVRILHSAAPLVWNQTLADAASGWADTCQVKHSDGTLLDTPYGENIVAATGHFPIAKAMQQFVLDEADYDPAQPTYNHFTQVVWKSTTQLGCAVATCQDLFDKSLGPALYYVCVYNPAGNVIGSAPANVQASSLF
ncbi:CAP domain-containing protein [Mycena capillaripes]|nr:CAP domain-containing protein [Mycena capillaripes]